LKPGFKIDFDHKLAPVRGIQSQTTIRLDEDSIEIGIIILVSSEEVIIGTTKNVQKSL
jgi:hypothetical protein